MFDLESLNIDKNSVREEYSSECLPFEESLDKAINDTQERTREELEQQWAEEDENRQIESESYIEYLEALKSDLLSNYPDEEDVVYPPDEENPTYRLTRD